MWTFYGEHLSTLRVGGEVFKLWLIEPNLSTLQFFSVILIIYKVLFYGAVTVVNKKYKQNTANQMILGHV